MPILSIIVPVYNEEEFLGAVLDRVLIAPLPAGLTRDILIVDDGSGDGSWEIAVQYATAHPELIRAVRHPQNLRVHRRALLPGPERLLHGPER